MKKVNELLTCAIMLDSLTEVCVQYMTCAIMLDSLTEVCVQYMICAIMLDSLTEVCVQYMIMLIALMKVLLSQELKYLCNNTTTGLSIELYQRTTDVRLLHFHFIRNN